MPNLITRMVAAEYAAVFAAADGLVLASFAGVTVEDSEAVRASLDEGGAKLRMVRNRLAYRALCDLGYEFPPESFTGNVSIVCGDAEAVIHAAKVLTSKEVKAANERGATIKILGGMLEKTQLDAADAAALADVPDKNTLRGQLLGVLQGPARGIASMLDALPSGFARVLQARVDGGSGQEAEAS